MSITYEIIDSLYRSRITLLEHLKAQGYNTEPFEKFSPKEIKEMAEAGAPALQMELKRQEPDEETGIDTCIVMYSLLRIKQKLTGATSILAKLADQKTSPWPLKSTEFIMVTLEDIPPASNFDSAAAESWNQHKMRIRFFTASRMIHNPLKHALVPKHERVPQVEHEALQKSLYATKAQFPLIRFHEDPIARWIGAVPGDIIKITRPSPTAGETVIYRLCVA
jgi:DNA-directed RNA polymerase subunit H